MPLLWWGGKCETGKRNTFFSLGFALIVFHFLNIEISEELGYSRCALTERKATCCSAELACEQLN